MLKNIRLFILLDVLLHANQIDAVAMGSPLAPVLANIFMGFHESNWFNEYNVNKPKLFLRYFDDILVAFGTEQDSLNF